MKIDNPLKMVGPWIGAILFFLLFINKYGRLDYFFSYFTDHVSGLLIQTLVGFGVGWYLQYTIKNLHKNNQKRVVSISSIIGFFLPLILYIISDIRFFSFFEMIKMISDSLLVLGVVCTVFSLIYMCAGLLFYRKKYLLAWIIYIGAPIILVIITLALALSALLNL